MGQGGIRMLLYVAEVCEPTIHDNSPQTGHRTCVAACVFHLL